MSRRFAFYTRASQQFVKLADVLNSLCLSKTRPFVIIAIFAETRPRRFADIVSAAVLITKLDFEAFL